jgi:hypothetical protein
MSKRQQRDRERHRRHDRKRRPLEVAIENRLAVCALMLMLAPYGMSLPTFAQAARAKRDSDVEQLVEYPSVVSYMPNLHAGGTIILSQPVIYVDPSRTLR